VSGTLDFTRAAEFVAAVPSGKWTSFGQVARAAGAEGGAIAIGDWLRRKGDTVPNVYRVLTVDGRVAQGFAPAGPTVLGDALTVRELLTREGVLIDAKGRASKHQCFHASDWARGD
jgi:alkylated DNA nucleotide flippase Atl1